jgi:hypothetical protein
VSVQNEIADVLNPSVRKKAKLKVVVHPSNGPYVQGASSGPHAS